MLLVYEALKNVKEVKINFDMQENTRPGIKDWKEFVYVLCLKTKHSEIHCSFTSEKCLEYLY